MIFILVIKIVIFNARHLSVWKRANQDIVSLHRLRIVILIHKNIVCHPRSNQWLFYNNTSDSRSSSCEILSIEGTLST